MQETKCKLNKISTDVLLAPRRPGNTVAIIPIRSSDRRERAGHEEQTTHPTPAASPCTAGSTRASLCCPRASSRDTDQGSPSREGQSSADPSVPSLHTLCSCKTRAHSSDLQDLCWSPATAWLPSQRSPAETEPSMLRGHSSLSPLSPVFLLPKSTPCVQNLPFGAAPCAAKAALAARVKGFYFHNNNYSTRSLSVIVLRGNQNLHFGNRGGFPSAPAPLCGGRSLIHGSVLQPSHDRWVGCSEIGDVVTHGIVPAAQGSHPPSLPAPKTVPQLLHPRGGDVPLAAAARPKSCTTTLWHLMRGSGAAGALCIPANEVWEAIPADSWPLRVHQPSSPV